MKQPHRKTSTLPDTELRHSNALNGISVVLSASNSADLARLGLTQRHTGLAVGEITRAVLIGGGTVVYGGPIKSELTSFLLHETHRYGHPESLTLCIAAPEHRKFTHRDLRDLENSVSGKGKIIYLDESGNIIDNIFVIQEKDPSPLADTQTNIMGYSKLSGFLTQVADARVIIGGQLETSPGEKSDLLEEALMSTQYGQPLYVVAGFGGAAALIAKALKIDDLSWAPDGFPERPEDERIDTAFNQLRSQMSDDLESLANCGLTQNQRLQLASSYRPREIASLITQGLAVLNRNRQSLMD